MKTIILAPDHTFEDDSSNSGGQVKKVTAPFFFCGKEYSVCWLGTNPAKVSIFDMCGIGGVVLVHHSLMNDYEDAICAAVQQFVGDKYCVMVDKD